MILIVLHFVVFSGEIFGSLSGSLSWRLSIFAFLALADYWLVEQICVFSFLSKNKTCDACSFSVAIGVDFLTVQPVQVENRGQSLLCEWSLNLVV